MRTVFVDTNYLVALANPKDQLHRKAKTVKKSLGKVRLVTTEEVLNEFLAYFSEYGREMRERASGVVDGFFIDPMAKVVEQSHNSFIAGLELYKKRPDKGYSLTDCTSMVTMRRLKITEVLTNDHHLEQEGFTILLKP